MKLINPQFEILEQAPGTDGLLKHIELCGRTCYKSQDKITEGSAEKFVERLKSLGHGSVLEHGTVYLCIENAWDDFESIQNLFLNKYTKVVFDSIQEKPYCFVTTNYRVLLQGSYPTWDDAVKNGFDKNWLDVLHFSCEPTIHHERRVTVRFTTDIGISRELNRHRANSVSEESTRYCNYSKGKFGGELSVVPPISIRGSVKEELMAGLTLQSDEKWLLVNYVQEVSEVVRDGESEESKKFFDGVETWLFAVLAAQWSYMRLVNVFGWSAQEARSILPLCTATELVHTAFVSDWINFFKLRCDSHAHPMARELAIPLKKEFIKRGLIENIIDM